MKKILILTEKSFTADKISNALSNRSEYQITVVPICGHIYLEEEKDILHISKNELQDCEKIIVDNDETGFVLGRDIINISIAKIKKLQLSSFDVIVDACDPDRSGKYLFQYVADRTDINTDVCVHMVLRNLSENSLATSFDEAMQHIQH